MAADEPPYLTVGTDVSAKYKGAFCEAKIKKVNRVVKCKVTFKNSMGSAMVQDEQIRGTLRIGAEVEARHPEKNQFMEAIINKMQDYSQYTVVFDDGDETTLRRTSLCLKSGRHFAESPTLDQFPLTNPEHFGTPVIGTSKTKRKRRSTMNSATLDYYSSDEDLIPKKGKFPRGKERDPDLGKVVCVDYGDRRKKDNWYPGLVVANTAQVGIRINPKEEYLIRSFKDGKYYQVPKKDTREFTREISRRVDNNTLRIAVEKAMLYFDKGELPPHWDKTLYFGLDMASNEEDSHDTDSDTSDDEPSEEKDRFVAQLYKFMDERGTPINKAPTVGSRDLNLYKLFKVVHKIGGYNRVTNQNKWKIVYNKMGCFPTNPSGSNQIKLAYKRYLHSFEDFYRKLGCTMVTNSRSTRGRHRSDRNFIITRNRDRDTSSPKRKKEIKDKSVEKKVEVKFSNDKKESKTRSETPFKAEEKQKSPEKKKLDKVKSEEKEEKVKPKREDFKPRLVRSHSLNKDKKDKDIMEEKKETRNDRAKAREDAKREKTESPEKKKETRSSAKFEQEKREKESADKKSDDNVKDLPKKNEKPLKHIKEEKLLADKKEEAVHRSKKVERTPKDKEEKTKNSSDSSPVKDKKDIKKEKNEDPPVKEKKADHLKEKKGDNSKEKKDIQVKEKKTDTQSKEKKTELQQKEKKVDQQQKEKKVDQQQKEKKIEVSQKEKKIDVKVEKVEETCPNKDKKDRLKDMKAVKVVVEREEKVSNKGVSESESVQIDIQPKEKVAKSVEYDKKEDKSLDEVKLEKSVEASDIEKDPFEYVSGILDDNDEDDYHPGKITKKRRTTAEEKDNMNLILDLFDDSDDDLLDPMLEKSENKECKEKNVEVGDKVKVKYGRGRTQKVYEAKVLKVEMDAGEKRYYVHYAGWNTRYDEWVRRNFIVENISEQNRSARRKKQDLNSKGASPPTQFKKIDRSRPPGAPSTSKLHRKNSTSSTNSSTVSASRTTRSDKSGLQTSPFCRGLQPRRRTRKKSGVSLALTDTSQDSESDDDLLLIDDEDEDVDVEGMLHRKPKEEEMFSDDEEIELETFRKLPDKDLEKNDDEEEAEVPVQQEIVSETSDFTPAPSLKLSTPAPSLKLSENVKKDEKVSDEAKPITPVDETQSENNAKPIHSVPQQTEKPTLIKSDDDAFFLKTLTIENKSDVTDVPVLKKIDQPVIEKPKSISELIEKRYVESADKPLEIKAVETVPQNLLNEPKKVSEEKMPPLITYMGSYGEISSDINMKAKGESCNPLMPQDSSNPPSKVKAVVDDKKDLPCETSFSNVTNPSVALSTKVEAKTESILAPTSSKGSYFPMFFFNTNNNGKTSEPLSTKKLPVVDKSLVPTKIFQPVSKLLSLDQKDRSPSKAAPVESKPLLPSQDSHRDQIACKECLTEEKCSFTTLPKVNTVINNQLRSLTSSPKATDDKKSQDSVIHNVPDLFKLDTDAKPCELKPKAVFPTQEGRIQRTSYEFPLSAISKPTVSDSAPQPLQIDKYFSSFTSVRKIGSSSSFDSTPSKGKLTEMKPNANNEKLAEVNTYRPSAFTKINTVSNFDALKDLNFPKKETTNFPKKETVNFPKKETVNFPKKEAVNFPKKETINFPKKETTNFPKKEITNFPKKEMNFPKKDAVPIPMKIPEVKEASTHTSVIAFASSALSTIISPMKSDDNKKVDEKKDFKTLLDSGNSKKSSSCKSEAISEDVKEPENKKETVVEKSIPKCSSKTESIDLSAKTNSLEFLKKEIDIGESIHRSLVELSIDEKKKEPSSLGEESPMITPASGNVCNVFLSVSAGKSSKDAKELFLSPKDAEETVKVKEDKNLPQSSPSVPNLNILSDSTILNPGLTTSGDNCDSVSSVSKSESGINTSPTKKEVKKKKSKTSKKTSAFDAFDKEDKPKEGKPKSKKKTKFDSEDLVKSKDVELKSKPKKIKKNKNKKRFSKSEDRGDMSTKSDANDGITKDTCSEKIKKKEKRKREEKKFLKIESKFDEIADSSKGGEFSKKERKKGKKNKEKMSSDKKGDLGEKKIKKKKKAHIEDNLDSDSEKDSLARISDKKKKKEKKKMKPKETSSSDDAADNRLLIDEGQSSFAAVQPAAEKREKPEDPDMSFLLCEEKVPASPVEVNSLPEDTTGSSSLDDNSNNRSPSSDEDRIQPVNLDVYPRSANMEVLEAINKRNAEACAVLDNTPPTTPSSSPASIPSRSPSHDRESFLHYTESTQSGRESCEGESDGFHLGLNRAEMAESEEYRAAATLAFAVCKSVSAEKPQSESPRASLKRQKSELEEYSPTKRRKKSKRSFGMSEVSKVGNTRYKAAARSPRGESLDTYDSSNASVLTAGSPPHGSVSTLFTSFSHHSSTQISAPSDNSVSSSLKTSKINFYVPLHEYKDPEKRIAVLQDKMAELRKLYASLKAEVATIDRRRKKARKKIKEAALSIPANNSSTHGDDAQHCS